MKIGDKILVNATVSGTDGKGHVTSFYLPKTTPSVKKPVSGLATAAATDDGTDITVTDPLGQSTTAVIDNNPPPPNG